MPELPLRPDLVGQQPYGAPVDAVPVRLNVNENPYPPPLAAVAAIEGAVRHVLVDLNRYPDREATRLREVLAAYVGGAITPDRIWPASGSNEVMHHLFGAFGGPHRTALSFAPTYSMYPLYARDTFTRYVTVPRRPDFSVALDELADVVAEHSPTILVVASPNNPTGTALSHDDVRELHSAIADTGVLIIDEAYAEFSGLPSAVPLVPDMPRLVVTRTLSKAFGMAGLRLGYAVAAPGIVDAARLVRLPYHLSSLDQAAAIAAVEHADVLLAPVAEVIAERELQAEWFADVGVPVTPSEGNFLLIGPIVDSHDVFCALLERGVLVRETSFPDHLRVSIGTPAENEAFRQAFVAVTGRVLEESQ